MKEIIKFFGIYILIIIFVISIIIVFNIKLNNSGSLGDTFGGLSSPFLGFYSIYLLYKTFKIQSDQLTDQKNTNFTQMSFIYLESIQNSINNFETENHNYYFKTPVSGASIMTEIPIYKGYEAITEFASYYNRDFTIPEIHLTSMELLKQINSQTESIYLIYKRIESLREKLIKDHYEFLLLLFHRLFNVHFSYSELAYHQVRGFLYQIKFELDQANDTEKLHIAIRNTSIEAIETLWNSYEKFIELFMKNDLVEKYVNVNKTFTQAFEEFKNYKVKNIDWHVRYRAKIKN